MAITPKTTLLNRDFIKQGDVSTTYKIDNNVSELRGEIDSLEALTQQIDKELNTEKYKYAIYSWNYGLQTQDLIGMDKEYAYLKLQARIEECLGKYSEIIEIKNFNLHDVEGQKDALHVTFDVISIYGNIEGEVNTIYDAEL